MTALGSGFVAGAGVGVPDDIPRKITKPVSRGDRVFRGVLTAAGVGVLVITGLIGVFLVIKSASALHAVGFGFFTNTDWIPNGNNFGIATILPNGVFIALIALVIAVPVALGTAVFITEYAPHRIRRILIAIVDLMAAIPSILYALWGIFFLEPRIIGTFRWVSDHLSFLPFFKVRGPHLPSAFTSSTALAGVVVSLMVIPIVASISREVFSQAPIGEREAAFALGASRWQVVRTVVIPFGRGGIIGAVMLGFGRALGETIAVALIISPTSELSWRVLENHGYSIPSLIALRYPESTPEMLSSLMAAGLVLFVITMVFNALSSIVINRTRSGAQTS